MNKEQILAFLKNNRQKFSEEFGVSRIGLFGSFANGKATAQSDVDILVRFHEGITQLHEKKTALQQYLTQSLNKEVDLCNEKYIRSYFKDQILNKAIYV